MKKGTTNNPNGRPPGSANKATKGMRERINAFLSDNWEAMQGDFANLSAKERFDFYIKLLSFSLPQLKSIEHSGELQSKLEGFTNEQLDELINEILNKDN